MNVNALPNDDPGDAIMARRREVVRLVKEGLTYAEIGRRLGGITRQRVHQLLKSAAGRPHMGQIRANCGKN